MNAVYVNNRRVSNIRISFGDTIFIAGVKIVYLGNIIAINNPNSMVSVRIFEYQNEYDDTLSAGNMAIDDRNVKYFARSLNVTSPLKTIERDIENIPNIQRTPQKQPLIYTIGPSLTMSLAMVASLGLTFYNQNTSQAGQNGIPVTMIVGITFAFVMLAGAVLWPILSHRFQTRSLDKRNGELTDKYLKYLSKLGGELNYKQNQNRITYGKLYPSPEKCLEICLTQERLWERSPKDELFLDVRVGIGARISPIRLNISRGSTGMEPEENDEIALALRNMENEFQFLKNVPVSVKLGKFKTGVCGRYALAANIMKAMIVQAASLHEPDEVKIAVIASDKLFAEWKWVKMLPHVWNSEHSQRYTAFNNEDTAVVCNSLNEIIKKQNEDIKDNRAGERLHYIVFVLDEAQNKSAAMARLVANAQNGQFSFVFTASTSDKLPDNCLTLIQCTREANSITDLPDSSGRMFMFRPDDMSSFPVDYFARTLARVQLRKAVEGVDLVDSVSYLDMYNVSDVKALAIESRWASNEALAAKVESGTEVAFLIISGAPMAEAVGF
jgi:S-DNA-T family DNA segregation ATPase FtsK/SpoIIIE